MRVPFSDEQLRLGNLSSSAVGRSALGGAFRAVDFSGFWCLDLSKKANEVQERVGVPDGVPAAVLQHFAPLRCYLGQNVGKNRSLMAWRCGTEALRTQPERGLEPQSPGCSRVVAKAENLARAMVEWIGYASPGH